MEHPIYQIELYAKAAAKLLQGPVFEDQKDVWQLLLLHEFALIRYFEKIALELIVDKRDGYAYLKQIDMDGEGTTIGLVKRIPLTYELSLVCVLLREWLHEFEADDLDNVNLYITPRMFRERIEMFFKEKSNQAKFIKDLNKHIDACEKMGFLKLTFKSEQNPDDHRYEVKRIIKARITNEELERFKKQLENELNTP